MCVCVCEREAANVRYSPMQRIRDKDRVVGKKFALPRSLPQNSDVVFVFVCSLELKWPEGSDDHDEYKDARAVCVTSSRDIGSNSGQPSDSCSYDSIKELAADRGGSLPPIEYIELAGFGHETRFEAGAAFSAR